MNIGDISNATGLPAKTIRYYEEIGLVTPGRGDNGYRVFADRDLHKLRFLGRARSLGFTLENCRQLLSLYDDKSRASADVKAIAALHLDRIDQKIAELESLRATLGELVEKCQGDDMPDCPILASLGAADEAAA